MISSSFCSSFVPGPSTSKIAKLISEQPHLSMLETKCTTMKDLQKAHAQLIKSGLAQNPAAANRLLPFCATSPAGDINYAYMMFDEISNPNLFTWNTIIRGFSNSSNPQFAISLFIELLVNSPLRPDRLTYPSVFKAYAQLSLAHDGAQLHGRIIKLRLQVDPFIRNTILHMYANCGCLSQAWKLFDENQDEDDVAWNSMIMGLAKCREIYESKRLFDKMPKRDRVSWNSMISGLVRNGMWTEALDLFGRMQDERIKPSEFTLVSLLNASSCLGSLGHGEWIHDYIKENNIEWNVIVVTAIIDMYCKCGRVEMAVEVFETSPVKGLPCWNAMIFGLAANGREDEAIQLFSRLQSSSLRPDSVSFIAVLTACNHWGMVDTAKYYFSLMTKRYKIEPSVKHYGCMVDVLGQAGLMAEARELIRSMPMRPDATIWGSFLSACRSCLNIDMAKWATKHIMKLDPNEATGNALISNVYAGIGQFEKAMQEWISIYLNEVNGEVHESWWEVASSSNRDQYFASSSQIDLNFVE